MTLAPNTDASVGSRAGMIALVTGTVAIAFSPIFARLAVSEGGIGPIASAFWRVGLAVPVFAVWLGRRGELRAIIPRGGGRRPLGVLLGSGLFFAGDLACWHWSFEFTPVANATVLANFSAVLVVIFSWLFLGERPRAFFLLGGLIALFGVVWLTFGTAAPAVSRVMPTSVGDGLALVTAFFYAGYLLTLKYARGQYSVGQVMALLSAVAAAGLLVPALISPEPIVPRSAEGWAFVLGLALVSQCVGQALVAFALARLTASFSAITLLLQPVMTALWGWVILAQPLARGQIVAGGVVLLGIGIARLASRPPNRPPQKRASAETAA